jgi:Staphylococcal nuclease homologue
MRLWLVLAATCAIGVLAAAAAGSPTGSFKLHGGVVHVVDGDTIDVALDSGPRIRVRLIGVDTPERGQCFFTRATNVTERLSAAKRVVLQGDATQATHDRYGRLLAYVWLPGGHDLGRLHPAAAARPRLQRHPVPELPSRRPRPAPLRRQPQRNRLRDLGLFDEPAERVREAHLLDGLAVRVQQPR